MLKVRLGRARGKSPARRRHAAGAVLGEIEEYFAETMTPGDTFVFAGEVLRFEGIAENECLSRTRAAATIPRSRPMPAASSRSRPSGRCACAACSPTPSAGERCRRRSPTGCALQRQKSVLPGPRATCWSRPSRAADRLYHGLLSVRGPARAPDARHAADAAAGARRSCGRWASSPPTMRWRSGRSAISARMFSAGRLEARRAVRRGHAGRRSRGLAGRQRPDEAHLPQLRDHRRPDRAAHPGPGEERPAGHDLDRPDLRRAEKPRARPLLLQAHGPTRRRACSMSGALWRTCSRASAGESCIKPLDQVSPLAVPVMLEIGREAVSGEAAEMLWRRRKPIADRRGDGDE